jgi:hypothetical protein
MDPARVTPAPLPQDRSRGEQVKHAALLTYKVLNDDVQRETRIKRLQYLARWMDSSIKVPGSTFTVGWDPIIGVIPVAGDLVSLALNLYILYEARRMKASISQLARIIANILIDFGVGSVPIAGDLFDFGFKCAERNLRVLGIEPLPPVGDAAETGPPTSSAAAPSESAQRLLPPPIPPSVQ